MTTIMNYAKNEIGLLIGGSSTNFPTHFIIGTGSGTTLPTSPELVVPTDTQSFTETSFPAQQKVKWQGDWNSIEMSGTNLQEFGVKVGSQLTGSIWSKTGIPQLTFDGTNELRIEEIWEVF